MQANGVPIPAVNRLESGAATGNLADPGKIIRPASPALSRGNLLATSFPLKEDSGTFVKETLSTQSKDVLVGWAKGAKEAVATEHAVSEAPRGRSWTALGDCVSPLGIASLGPFVRSHSTHPNHQKIDPCPHVQSLGRYRLREPLRQRWAATFVHLFSLPCDKPASQRRQDGL